MRIRPEVASDAGAIEAVTVAAFKHVAHSGHTEQFIIRELRRSGVLSVSLVAEDNGAVVGHVAVSPVVVSDGATGWYGPGPISVAPAHQGRGVGTRVMEHALAALRALAANGCVVLGEPGYYSRFGFTAQPSMVLPGVPPAYFQATSFNGSLPSGEVSYHAAFAAEA